MSVNRTTDDCSSVRLHWWRDRNFGDALNTVLLRKFGIPTTYSEAREADVIGVGSILQFVPSSFSGTILGTGFMWEHNHVRFANARHMLLRGQLTAQNCDAPKSTLLGDPGLLVVEFAKLPLEPRFELGIVPHYVDKQHQAVRELCSRYYDDLRVINIRAPIGQVVTDIAECSRIASSSLHGLIAADALGIPNLWITLTNKVLGDGFKFRDYFSAFSRQARPHHPYALRGDENLTDLTRRMLSPGNATQEVIGRLRELFASLTPDELRRDSGSMTK